MYMVGLQQVSMLIVIVLTLIQAQIPLAALRIVHKTLIGQRGPEADTFFWDGSHYLPILYLNLHIASLSCIQLKSYYMICISAQGL